MHRNHNNSGRQKTTFSPSAKTQKRHSKNAYVAEKNEERVGGGARTRYHGGAKEAQCRSSVTGMEKLVQAQRDAQRLDHRGAQ